MQEFDVVVVGAGIAGMAAANRAAELGRRVAVLEAGAAQKYLCNSRYTGGTFHVCMGDIMAGRDALLAAQQRSVGAIARPDLMEAIAQDAERSVRWLQAQGIRFIKASAAVHQGWVVAPPGRTRPGLDWEGRSGDVMLSTLETTLLARAGKMFRGMRATSLRMQDGRCIGVTASHGGVEHVFGARAVVLADGGFQGNLDMVSAHITPDAAKLRQRGAGTGVGDGMRMAVEAGAAVSALDRFYGHLLSIDALHNDQLWPYPYPDAIATAAIVVGRDGRRFADEGRGGVFLANALAQLADPLSATIILDDAIWDGPGRNGLVPANPHLPKCGGTFFSAPDLATLAQKANLPADELIETVNAYNAAFNAGKLADLSPPRASGSYKPMPIVKGPFHALPICAGITHTMGGIAIDMDGRVQRADDTAIDGLYAAGGCTGGLEGGPTVGYVGGLVKGAVFGLRSAEHIAAAAKQ
jgi:fumarate reductase flavoprotein subunit